MVKKKARALPVKMKKQLLGKGEEISVHRQSELLQVPRTHIYYMPVQKTDEYESIRPKIFEIWLDNPARGARFIRAELRKQGVFMSRKKIRALMIELGIKAVRPKRNLSKAAKEHKKYPYLLRNVKITRPNQVWSTDITYVRVGGSYVYLTAIIDWYSRKILSWRISNSLHNSFCIDALEEALAKYGKPEIFNTDQGTQYTADNWISILQDHRIQISMDGKGRALDNVYIERFWRTVKWEHIYLWKFETLAELRESLNHFLHKYNYQRGHQSLNDMTPDQVYNGRYYEYDIA